MTAIYWQFITVQKGRGGGSLKQNNRNNQTQGEEALRDGPRRDRERVFDCPDSEQYCIEIEVWSSLYK